MKPVILLMIASALITGQVPAQHPLVGTWEMISVKGIDAEGNPFFHDTTAVRETKIITPTHYMLIAWDVDQDSLTFNRTMAGQVALEGEKYIENPTQASVQIFENVKVDFRWKLDGDIFTQSGTIVRPDGKLVVLEALKFRRVTNVPRQVNPAIGTWRQLSGHYATPDGKQNTTFSPTDSRLLIVTPTHWMRMDTRSKKFDGALYGTYGIQRDSIFTRLDFSTYPFSKGERSNFTQKVDGNRLHITGKRMTPQGEEATFYDTLERVE